MDVIAVPGSQLVAGLVIGIVLLVYMMLRTKIHAILALIVASVVTGLICGLPAGNVSSAISTGFGNTLGSIGIIIGFGVMMGQIFEVSGAAETMAYTFIKKLGKGKEDLAMAITGFIVSIPIFCDSGFIIISPIAKSISRKTKRSVVGLGVALASGLVITHSMVPPTPGPVGVAGIFNVSIGALLLWGLVLCIPMAIAGLLYARYIGEQIYLVPDEEGEGFTRLSPAERAVVHLDLDSSDKKLPSVFLSFLPIILPIILILLSTVTGAIKAEGTWVTVIKFLGTPIIAVGLGLIAAIYGLAGKMPRDEVIIAMEKGIRTAGIIILLTGAGGAFGYVIRESGAGNFLASQIASYSIPPILIPFIIASVMRLIQGSGTVAMTTAASITAPILISLPIDPIFAALACCTGSLVFSYFSDSYFWVVNRTLGVTQTKDQIRVWSVTTTIIWAVGFVCLMIMNAIFG